MENRIHVRIIYMGNKKIFICFGVIVMLVLAIKLWDNSTYVKLEKIEERVCQHNIKEKNFYLSELNM